MSKSAGGFITLQSLVDSGYDPLDYRYFLLGGHYRSQLQFSYEALDSAKNARRSLMEKVRALAEKARQTRRESGNTGSGAGSPAYLEAFGRALEDDLSTPRALAELWGLLKDNSLEPAGALAAVLDMDRVLGLNLEAETGRETSAKDEELAAEIEKLITERAAAKQAGDFVRADSIRTGLKERGIILEDGKTGTVWRRG
jgi:cysteinyl-tRNA synthetase